jgi:hypothetical protein
MITIKESLRAAGYATGQSVGMHRKEIYCVISGRTVGAMKSDEAAQWVAFGAPLDERGVAMDLPRSADGPCMPPGQELVRMVPAGSPFSDRYYAEECAL